MFENRLKALWAQGRPAINGWLSVGNPFIAEIMAGQGYDSITIDLQHGALDYGQALPMFQALRASGVVPLARVPWNEAGSVMKVLDAGAMGVICPMINSAAEAAQFVSYLRYPPLGQRSFGPTRASFAYGGYDTGAANDQILALAMIETQAGVDNLEAIAATPGLDGLYIGPSDLTLGTRNGRLPPGFDREEPEIVELIRHIQAVCAKNGLRACLHCGEADYAARAIGWGFDLTTVSGDTRLLAMAAAASVARWRELVDGGKAAAPAGKAGY